MMVWLDESGTVEINTGGEVDFSVDLSNPDSIPRLLEFIRAEIERYKEEPVRPLHPGDRNLEVSLFYLHRPFHNPHVEKEVLFKAEADLRINQAKKLFKARGITIESMVSIEGEASSYEAPPEWWGLKVDVKSQDLEDYLRNSREDSLTIESDDMLVQVYCSLA